MKILEQILYKEMPQCWPAETDIFGLSIPWHKIRLK